MPTPTTTEHRCGCHPTFPRTVGNCTVAHLGPERWEVREDGEIVGIYCDETTAIESANAAQ